MGKNKTEPTLSELLDDYTEKVGYLAIASSTPERQRRWTKAQAARKRIEKLFEEKGKV